MRLIAKKFLRQNALLDYLIEEIGSIYNAYCVGLLFFRQGRLRGRLCFFFLVKRTNRTAGRLPGLQVF
jgi:hypothetical protein